MSALASCLLCGGRRWQPVQRLAAFRVVAEDVDAAWDIDTWLCLSCSLVFAHPQPDAALLDRFYAAQFRDLSVAGDPGSSRVPAEGSRLDQAAWIEARLGGLHGARVLEIGCYDGHLLHLLAGRGARVVGLEPSATASAHARSRYGLDVRTCSLETAALPGGSFDLVLLSHVLEHLRDPRLALARCRELVKTGGALFVEVPNVLRPRFASVVDFFTFDHLFHFSPYTLGRLAGDRGFRAVCVDEEFPFPAFRWLGRAEERMAPAPDPGAAARAVEAARRAVTNYAAERQAFVSLLRRRLEAPLARWRASGARVVVYGAGFHTEHLLRETDLASANIVALVDGNPKKQGRMLHGYRVFAPEDLPALAPEVVVVSSFDFQDEIVSTVQRVLRARPPAVLTFYQEPQAFSTFRRGAPEAIA